MSNLHWQNILISPEDPDFYTSTLFFENNTIIPFAYDDPLKIDSQTGEEYLQLADLKNPGGHLTPRMKVKIQFPSNSNT